MLTFIINDTGAMLATAEHGMCPFIQTVPLHYIVRHEKVFVGTCDDANVHVSNVFKPMHFRMMVIQFIDERSRRWVEERSRPLALHRLAVDGTGSRETGCGVEPKKVPA